MSGGVWMRINLHDKTPRPAMKNYMKVLLIYLLLSFYGMFVFLACCIFIETDEIAVGVAVLVLPPVVVAPFALSMVGMGNSYAEFDGENVLVVECYFWGEKRKSFSRSEISSRESSSASFNCPGRRIIIPIKLRTFIEYRYIVFRNADGKYLFKILETPEGIEWSDMLMNK